MIIKTSTKTATLLFAENELTYYFSFLADFDFHKKIDIELKVDSTFLPVKDAILDDAFSIRLNQGAGEICGINERSVLLGCYHLLYTLGFRFLLPNRENDIIPNSIKEDLLTLSVNHIYPFRNRGVCIEGANSIKNIIDFIDWMPKLGLNSFFSQFEIPYTFLERWYRHEFNPTFKQEKFNLEIASSYFHLIEEELKKRSLLLHTYGHGWTAEAVGYKALSWHRNDTENLPSKTSLALLNGKRELFNGVAINTHLCYTKPGVLAKISNLVYDYVRKNSPDYVHVWLADENNNVCECENCRKFLLSDLYVELLNQIDEKLSAHNLDTKIVFLLYQELLFPPEKNEIKNPSRFTMMFAPINRLFNFSYPDKKEAKKLPSYKRNQFSPPISIEDNLDFLFAWQEKFHGDSFIYDYPLGRAHYGDLSYYFISEIIFNDVQKLKSLNLNGYISCQELRVSLPNALPNYTLGRALSGFQEDFSDIANDYFKHAYYPHHNLILSYLKEVSSYCDCDYFNGKGCRVNPSISEKYNKLSSCFEKYSTQLEQLPTTLFFNLLRYHNSYGEKLSKALYFLSTGEKNKTISEWNTFIDFIRKQEKNYQAFLDVYRIIEVAQNYTGFYSDDTISEEIKI